MLYADELHPRGQRWTDVDVSLAYTREAPPGWPRPGRPPRRSPARGGRRGPPSVRPTTYICGPTAFVETVADLLLAAGHEARRIRTERFG